MRINDIATIAQDDDFPITRMKDHEQLFYSSVLATISQKSTSLYIKEDENKIRLYYRIEDVSYPLYQVPMEFSKELVSFASRLSVNNNLCDVIENISGYFLMNMQGELVHCFITDFRSSGDSVDLFLAFGFVFNQDRAPGVARSIIDACQERGMFRETD